MTIINREVVTNNIEKANLLNKTFKVHALKKTPENPFMLVVLELMTEKTIQGNGIIKQL
jgi:hypothetical protein